MEGGYLFFLEHGELLFSRRLSQNDEYIDRTNIAAFLSELDRSELEFILNESQRLINEH